MSSKSGYSETLRTQIRWFAVLSVPILVATGCLAYSGPELFQRFFGNYSPVLIILAVICIGASAGWFLFTRMDIMMVVVDEWARGLLFSGIGATLIVLPTILVDTFQPFPEDMNVAVPAALLFYPIMGYVVEITFHLVPLSILLLVVSKATDVGDAPRQFWTCAAIAATLEPGFQIWAGATEQGWTWKSIYLGVHLFLFSVVQFYVLKRFGFVHMFLFRMTYYLHWHILWGTLRTSLLF